MRRTRIIPLLLLDEKKLVKTKRFRNPAYLGDPINAVRIFSDKGVDELILLDISADRKKRGPDLAFIERVAAEALMPICYGGGIRTVDDAVAILKAGVEKVSINTAFLDDSRILSDVAAVAGRQSVVCSIDVVKNSDDRSFVHGAAQPIEAISAAREAVHRGAGELLLCAVDRDGCRCGLDIELIGAVSEAVSVPVIAAGGARGKEDFISATRAGAAAVAVGASFVYYGKHEAVLLQYPDDVDLDSYLP